MVGGFVDYRRRTVSEDQRRVCGSEVQIFTVSLNGAKILSTLIHSPLLVFWGSQDRITGNTRHLATKTIVHVASRAPLQ
jgi:hypothetical protein